MRPLNNLNVLSESVQAVQPLPFDQLRAVSKVEPRSVQRLLPLASSLKS